MGLQIDSDDPRQLSFFPELEGSASIPSLSTLPEFDQALSNLIKMSDLGAFIQLHIQGLEKGYSINLMDMNIPADFIKLPTNYSALNIHLFPIEIRHQLKKFTYDIKAFFNRKNSFRTSFGYFLFRSHFSQWKQFIEGQRNKIIDYLTDTLGRGKYGQFYLKQLKVGNDHIKSLADITAPWEFRETILLKDVEATRKTIATEGLTLHTLKATELDFPFLSLILKTQHIPLVLHQYLHQVQIHFVFKTIHLEYLSDININTIEDIRQLTEHL